MLRGVRALLQQRERLGEPRLARQQRWLWLGAAGRARSCRARAAGRHLAGCGRDRARDRALCEIGRDRAGLGLGIGIGLGLGLRFGLGLALGLGLANPIPNPNPNPNPIPNPNQVRFVFVSFVGEALGVMRRARISTLRGEI